MTINPTGFVDPNSRPPGEAPPTVAGIVDGDTCSRYLYNNTIFLFTDKLIKVHFYICLAILAEAVVGLKRDKRRWGPFRKSLLKIMAWFLC